MTRHIKYLLALMLVLSCTPIKRPDPVIPTNTDMCLPACEHMTGLGCDIPADCEAFCVEFQDNGVPLMPSCILKQTRCNDIGPNCFDH